MTGVIINLDNERLLRTYDIVSKEIVNYINNMDLIWEIEIARKIYFGKAAETTNPDNTSISYKPFIQWLIFSYKIYNGCPLIDCIYDTCFSRIGKFEQEALIGLKNTHEGLYKVYSIEGEKILVKDVFSQKSTYIWDSLLARSVKRYCGVFVRITTINNKNIVIPGYSVMTNSLLKNTEEYIIRKFREYNQLGGYSTIHNFINSNSLMLHKYFLRYVM
jgi:hypothetical protein